MGYDSLYGGLTGSFEAMELSGGNASTSSGINGNCGRFSSGFGGPMEDNDLVEEQRNGSSSSCCDPDLEWVNELLM